MARFRKPTLAILAAFVVGGAGVVGGSAVAADSNRGGNGVRNEANDNQYPLFVPEHIWVDGVAYDTMILGDPGSLPSNDHNTHSFNKLYVFPNGEQVDPIAEYVPGDPEYRGRPLARRARHRARHIGASDHVASTSCTSSTAPR